MGAAARGTSALHPRRGPPINSSVVDTLPASQLPLSESELTALGRAAGIPLTSYRRAHVERCAVRAIVRAGCVGPVDLAERLGRDARARAAFRRSVLVPVTRMFRDAHEFEVLEADLLPGLLRDRGRLSVWSAGCATGEELRSVAVLLERRRALERSYLVGTDVLEDVIDTARASTPWGGAVFHFERRDLLLDDAPPCTFDLVLCRNVGIYLEPSAQARLHVKLASALTRNGLLMLGRSETLLRAETFGLEQVTRHVFRKARA